MRIFVTALVAVFAVACGDAEETPARYGPVEIMRTPLSFAEDVEVIVSDVRLAPDTEVPNHSHAAEELVYVLEGSVVHVEEGLPERTMRAGDMVVITPEAAHSPRSGPDGARAVTIRFRVPGRAERDPVPATADDS